MWWYDVLGSVVVWSYILEWYFCICPVRIVEVSIIWWLKFLSGRSLVWFPLGSSVGAILFRVHCWISVDSHREWHSVGQYVYLVVLHEAGELSVVDIDKLVAEEELSPSLNLWFVWLCGNHNNFEFPLLSFRGIIPSLGLVSVDCGNIDGKNI